MSITAKLLYIALKLSGIKKKYTLPEAAFLEQVRKKNKKRGFYVPNNKKAIYGPGAFRYDPLLRDAAILQRGQSGF